jgi:hypothetical protein
VAELQHVKHRRAVEQDTPPQWEHSIRMDVATRYLLQVCIDYIQLFDLSLAQAAREGGMTVAKYIETHSDQPEWAFLTYASVYWVEHYRGLRNDLRNCFDFMFSPKNIIFKIWTSKYLNWSRDEVDRSSEQSSGRPINAQQMADIGNKGSTTGLLEVYGEEEKFQRILDFFTLGGIDTELYDEEYLDESTIGKRPLRLMNRNGRMTLNLNLWKINAKIRFRIVSNTFDGSTAISSRRNSRRVGTRCPLEA